MVAMDVKHLAPRPVRWMASSLRDLKSLPDTTMKIVGRALQIAQFGGTSDEAKPLKGFRGASVMEIVADHDTYRAAYVARFPEAVYVLHAFQKKSKSGIATPKRDLDLIRQRYQQVLELRKR